MTFPYRPNRILSSTILSVLSTLCSVTSGLSKVLVLSVDPVKALPSPAKASSSNFFLSRFVLGFGFHPTGDHCLETSFLLSLQHTFFFKPFSGQRRRVKLTCFALFSQITFASAVMQIRPCSLFSCARLSRAHAMRPLFAWSDIVRIVRALDTPHELLGTVHFLL